jgi:hypothetical protein
VSPLAGPGPAHRGQRPFVRQKLGWESWENQPLRGENKRPSPHSPDSYFLSLSGCPDRGDKTQCLGQAAMLGEAAGRQLGAGEWEGEGGCWKEEGVRPVLGSWALSERTGGRWETGPLWGGRQ